MRRKTRTGWCLSAVVALGIGALGLAPVTSASAAAPAKPVSPGMVSAMQRDLGLTQAQATARLKAEATASALAPDARRAAGAAYGGEWFDAGSGKLVWAKLNPSAVAPD